MFKRIILVLAVLATPSVAFPDSFAPGQRFVYTVESPGDFNGPLEVEISFRQTEHRLTEVVRIPGVYYREITAPAAALEDRPGYEVPGWIVDTILNRPWLKALHDWPESWTGDPWKPGSSRIMRDFSVVKECSAAGIKGVQVHVYGYHEKLPYDACVSRDMPFALWTEVRRGDRTATAKLKSFEQNYQRKEADKQTITGAYGNCWDKGCRNGFLLRENGTWTKLQMRFQPGGNISASCEKLSGRYDWDGRYLTLFSHIGNSGPLQGIMANELTLIGPQNISDSGLLQKGGTVPGAVRGITAGDLMPAATGSAPKFHGRFEGWEGQYSRMPASAVQGCDKLPEPSKPAAERDNAASLVAYGRPEDLRNLLARGLSPDAPERSGSGKSLLCYAIETGDREMTRVLLDASADPNHACQPLLIAINNVRAPLVELLLQRGAQWDLGVRGLTETVEAAFAAGRKDIYDMLVRAGAPAGYAEMRFALQAQDQAKLRKALAGSLYANAAGKLCGPKCPAKLAGVITESGGHLPADAPGFNVATPLMPKETVPKARPSTAPKSAKEKYPAPGPDAVAAAESGERKHPAPVPSASDPSILRVYMSGNYMPLHGMRGQQRTGIEAEIAEALAAAMGKRIEYYDRERAGAGSLEAVAQGRVDIALNAITPTPERAERVDFTMPIVRVPVLIAHKFETRVQSLKDLAMKKIAVPKGPLSGVTFGSGSTVRQYDSLAEAVESTTGSETEAVAAEAPALREAVENTNLTISRLEVRQSPVAIAVPRGKKAEYDAVLAGMNDKLDPIRSKWSRYWARFQEVSVGRKTACAVTETKALACFGDQEELLVPPAGSFIGVTMGAEHACAIRDDYTVACWGRNDQGQAAPKAGKFNRVTAGVDHTCGLRGDGSVICWGANQHGQRDAPPGKYSTVGAGDGFSCGLQTDGRVVCWGREFAAISSGPFTRLAVGPMGACGLRAYERKNECWTPNGKIKTRDAMTNLSVGFDAACGIEDNAHSVKCFGASLGYVPEFDFTQVEAGQGMACGVKSDGRLECWGSVPADLQQMTTAGGAAWPTGLASQSKPLPLVGLCENGRIGPVGVLDPIRGLLPPHQGGYDTPDAVWYTCSRNGPRTIERDACKGDDLLATVPLTKTGKKLEARQPGRGETYKELSDCKASGYPGSLLLSLYEYDPAKARDGGVAPCTGLVLEWTGSPGRPAIDIGGCTGSD